MSQYERIERLGRGTYGVVWSAKELDEDGTTISPVLAIKILLPADNQSTTKLREIAEQEYKALRGLKHRHIVDLIKIIREYEYDDHGVYPAIVMEHIKGKTLDVFSKRYLEHNGAGLRQGEILFIVHAIAEALGYAHNLTQGDSDRGRIHRDISSKNIMVTSQGDVKLMDFGVAHLVSDYLQGGDPIGTPPYAAPEIWDPDQHATPTSDVYSLGVVLHELMTGERYMAGCDPKDRIRRTKALTGPPGVDQSSHPSWLVDLHDRMLDPRTPYARPTAREVARIIQNNGSDVTAGYRVLREHYPKLFAAPPPANPPTYNLPPAGPGDHTSNDHNELADTLPHLSSLLTNSILSDLIAEAPSALKQIRKKTKHEISCSDYIAALDRAPADRVGVSVCFVDGATPIGAGHRSGIERESNGAAPANWASDERNNGFTMQSISKVFALLYVIDRRANGAKMVSRNVGWEPAGTRFGEYATVEVDREMRPANPLINAGALCVTALFPEFEGLDHFADTTEERIGPFLSFVRELCGDTEGSIVIDYEAWEQERRSAHNNHVLAWTLLRDKQLELPTGARCGDSGEINERFEQRAWVHELLDTYFAQCSVVVSCDHLAHAAAVLANGGCIPGTTRRLVKREHVELVLPLMATCGLYDGTGEFVCRTGLPAKSGIGGGIMSVVPGRCGIATWSPLLDEPGNSVLGKWMLHQLADPPVDESTLARRLHLFARPLTPQPLRTFDSSEKLDELCLAIKEKHLERDPKPEPPEQPFGDDRRWTRKVAACIWNLGPQDSTPIGSKHADVDFSIQAIANVLTLLFALDRSTSSVWTRVGREPSGARYDKSSWLERADGQSIPANPLINAGALTIISLIARPTRAAAAAGCPAREPLELGEFFEFVAKLCGRDSIEPDEEAVTAELDHDYSRQNRVIAWELARQGRFDKFFARCHVREDGAGRRALVERLVEAYLRTCHIRLSCVELAHFAALLAGNGRLPGRQDRIVEERIVREVVSLMFTSGMYDGSGEFARVAGIPAKGGMSGGIIAVAPGRMGLAAYSPRVNKRGNSYWGRHLLAAISEREELSVFRLVEANEAAQ